MYLERKEDLSVYYYLVDLFSDTSFMHIVDGFPESNLELPTVAVEASTIDTYQLELGNKNRYQDRTWFIDVFAVNKSQRDDIAYRIMNSLEDCIPVYDYDEGFPPEVSPTQLGCLQVQDIRLQIVRVFPELTGSLYYRATVSFTAIYNLF